MMLLQNRGTATLDLDLREASRSDQRSDNGGRKTVASGACRSCLGFTQECFEYHSGVGSTTWDSDTRFPAKTLATAKRDKLL